MTDRKVRQKYSFNIDTLNRLTKNLNMVFCEICKLFNQDRGLVLWGLDDEMEEIMDSIAKQSPLIRMPEDQPDYWEVYKKELSIDDLNILNHYRGKFGLPYV
ncbi:hypothetical protein G4V39_02250 [Thermosulfuriphilus ammonigenes]|uniref:Uncharacterized protein n=1 Tax=Thermosulfuriphilus ammonigenes TaxID=1936021 RepID=A0A6G7PUA6_9BACT|nr:hypothetical protein [Thermosulfuriphilus ammonigenes]MBA2848697.1 hypothetical protein [Thermosulfuriphilus ammonigenes]QIJ71167.1 hypothetical protein G4V39_02250 [Thermosulfuriphilus ammonigenes]